MAKKVDTEELEASLWSSCKMKNEIKLVEIKEIVVFSWRRVGVWVILLVRTHFARHDNYAGVRMFSREMKDLVIPSYAHTPWARQAITERLW